MKRKLLSLLSGILIGTCLFIGACTLDTAIKDMPVGGINFSSAQSPQYINKTEYEFDFSLDLKGFRNLEQMKVVTYESEDCSGPIVNIDDIDLKDQRARATRLEDGKKYSFRIQVTALVTDSNQTFQSPCTPWVGVDQQNPDAISLLFPQTNIYTTETKFVAQWAQGRDNGISGLANKPYIIKLFSQENCTGTLLKKIRTAQLATEFTNLDQGTFYSYQVLAVDQADNESVISCSSSMEIDTFAPGIKISNSGSDAGFTSDRTVAVEIVNDSWAGYWCVTEDASFRPTSISDNCPGGSGPTNGWSTSRPTDFTLSDGDGIKNVYVWLLDPSGTPRTNKQPTTAITLDRVAPGAFNVLGITGGSDTILNDRLSDDEDPVIHWSPATGAKDYSVKILNQDFSTRCSLIAVFPDVEAKIEDCSLQEATPYIVRIIAKDSAGNITAAVDYNFQKDTTPPGPFNMTGIDGGSDILLDNWSAAHPRVHWGASADAVKYWISISEQTSSAPICAEEEVSGATLDFDFLNGTCSALVSGGTYEVHLRSEDKAGLTTTATNAPFVFRADLEPPVLQITQEPLALSENTSTTFEFSVNDDLSGMSSVECRWDSESFATCVSPVVRSSLTEGSHSFDIKATDKVGNVTSFRKDFLVDISSPTVHLTQVPLAFSSSSTAHIEFNASDVGPAGLDHIECQLDGSAWGNCFSPLDYIGLSAGSHQIKVRATDRLGHQSAEALHNWFIDLTAPIVTLTSTPADGSTITSASVSFTATDDETSLVAVECQWNGGAWSSCSSPSSRSGLSAGLNTVSVRATNQAGLTSSQDYSWNIYSYFWNTSTWGACDASQPGWQTGGWGGCDAPQPAFTYDAWGTCSCAGVPDYAQPQIRRNQYCSVNYGNQWRSVSCPVNGGNQWRSVWCQRSDGATVADTYCGGGKPAPNTACSRNDCAGGAPAGNLSCSRGGGGDCYGAQETAQNCLPAGMVSAYCLYGVMYYTTDTGENGGGASCFVAETLVELADGRKIRIDSIENGAQVRSAFGNINTVLHVERVPLANRDLVGLNGETPFFTPEHPFLTSEGWKSLDPETTALEHGFKVVGALKVGDLVLHKGNWVRIESFRRIKEPVSKTVYNLILDGDHSYIANDYGVHNKN